MRLPRYQRGLGLFLVFVIAMASAQFAALSIKPETTDPALAAYLASGGSLADLCLTGDAEHAHGDCPFCRDLDLVVIIPPLIAAVPERLSTEYLFTAKAAAPEPPLSRGTRSARAPPVV